MGERPTSRLWVVASYIVVAAIAAFRPRTRSGLHPSLYPASPHRTAEACREMMRVADPDHTKPETDAAHQSDVSLWYALREAAKQWVAHKDARLGAALAYYSVFSIGPLILIAIAIAGLLFTQDVVRQEAITSLRSLLGESGAQAVEGMLASAAKPQQGLIASTIGIVMLLFAAIGVVVQLKDAFNTIWEVKSPPDGGVWGFVRTYVLSLAGVLALGFLLLVSML